MPEGSVSRMLPWLALAASVIALDQLTKYVIHQTLTYGRVIEVLSFFNLVLVYNPGAAFSFLSDQPGWQRDFFIGVAIVASVWVVYLLARHGHRRLFSVALSLILGGAIGNMIDRVIVGAVIDFIQLHAAGYYWPAFNVADSAISCGAALLILDSFRKPASHPVTEASVK